MNNVKNIFPENGVVINKSISNNFRKLPNFVSDYLVSQLVDPTNPEIGIQKITKILEENFIDSDKKELVKSRIKELGRYSFLGNINCRFDQNKNEYFASVNVLEDNNIRISPDVLEKYGDILLTTGCYGSLLVAFEPFTLTKKKNYPFIIIDFVPFQITNININSYIEKRKNFLTDEWIDIIINSIGFNPEYLTREQKLLYVCRLTPFVESNLNTIELGGTETAKTHIYRNLSQYGILLSGSNPSMASLFYNKLRRTVGILCKKDCVIFDEISGTKFNDEELINSLKDFMNSGKFSRDRVELTSGCSVVFIGNIDTDTNKQEVKNYYHHLFTPLPVKIRNDRAFLDRIHGFLPGWKLPRISVSSLSSDYGFMADYISEIFHRFRDIDYSDIIKSKIKFDNSSFRNQQAVTKLCSALIKIIYPDKNITDSELNEILNIAIDLRQRVIDQLGIIAPSEFKGIKIQCSIL
jgi:ATP-dependent Lon protease